MCGPQSPQPKSVDLQNFSSKGTGKNMPWVLGGKVAYMSKVFKSMYAVEWIKASQSPSAPHSCTTFLVMAAIRPSLISLSSEDMLA